MTFGQNRLAKIDCNQATFPAQDVYCKGENDGGETGDVETAPSVEWC
jgi:hypothetical protein